MGRENKIPLDSVKKNAIFYINSFDTNKTRSTSRNIKCVDVITSRKDAKTEFNTLLDTIMYVVNFSNSTGYILLSSDNRTSNIFGY